jgi:hypothetical protein
MMIGRRRERAPSRSASRLATPCSRSWLTLSIRMIAFFTTMPTSRIRPMNTTTEIVEPVSFRPDRADQRQRDGEQDHERMQQRFELRGHHQVDQEDRQAEREQQRIEALASSSSPWPATRSDTRAPADSRHDRCTSARRTQIAMSRRLAETMATRTWSTRWISLGPTVDTTSATESSVTGRSDSRIHDQATDILHRGTIGGSGAHQHVDLAVAEAVARGDFATHLRTTRSAIWRVVRPSAAARSWSKRIWISGKPCFHRRLHVGVAIRSVQQSGQLAACGFDLAQVLTAQFDLPAAWRS